MFRPVLILAALALLASCDRAAAPSADKGDAPQLQAPAPDAEPSRGFAAVNDAATSATGDLTVAMALRMPDAPEAEGGGAGREVLTLRGANGLVVEAELVGVASPATVVEGQTVRALMSLPVEASQTLIYRVTSETKTEAGAGLCGTGDTSHILVWEPEGPGEPVFKAMGISGAAPGAAGARLCPALDYRRA